jgi:hypothetical protein
MTSLTLTSTVRAARARWQPWQTTPSAQAGAVTSFFPLVPSGFGNMQSLLLQLNFGVPTKNKATTVTVGWIVNIFYIYVKNLFRTG